VKLKFVAQWEPFSGSAVLILQGSGHLQTPGCVHKAVYSAVAYSAVWYHADMRFVDTHGTVCYMNGPSCIMSCCVAAFIIPLDCVVYYYMYLWICVEMN